MIKKIETYNEILNVLNYIGDDYKTVPYLYVNLIKYGLGTNNVETWVDYQTSDIIKAVYLVYYDCIHIFTKETKSYNISNFINFIREKKHNVIITQEIIGDRLSPVLQENYWIEKNHVVDMSSVGLIDKKYHGEIAEKKDIVEIADLLIADSEFSNVYERQRLIDQLIERFEDGFSRYFVIKKDNKIIAAYNTSGEVPGFAIVNGLIVHPQYRHKGYASEIVNFACNTLEKENIKSRVSFVNYKNNASLLLHEKLGAINISTLSKFVKK